MKYRSMTKAELARAAGVSQDTFRHWLRRLEPELPDYDRKQRLLTPAQVRTLCERLCIDLPP